MNKEFNGFDEMVEALEENEDMVECKECFDLVPKVDCERAEVGYICPTCKGLRTAPAQARFVDPYDSYTQDFPEVTEYDPDSVVEYEKEPGLGDALSDLIRDEYEAIEGYEIADETVQHADIDEDEKDEILDILDHIKEEEEEHIDELKKLCPECDPEKSEEPEKLEEKLPREPQVYDDNGKLIKVKDPEILKIWGKVMDQAEADGITSWDDYATQKQIIDKALNPEEIEKLKKVEFEDGSIRAAYESLREDATMKYVDTLYSVMNGNSQVFTGTEEECKDWLEKHKSASTTMPDRFKIVKGANVPVIKEDLNLDPAIAARLTKSQLDNLTPEEIEILQHPLKNREAVQAIIDKYNPKKTEGLVEEAEEEVEEILEEESPEEEVEDFEENENEEVSDLDSAYEAAFEIANESGVGQVFGYARKETEEFVAIEPFEVDDPEAVEDDLMAVYDDVAYAYVAYPDKELEESLFESVQLNEVTGKIQRGWDALKNKARAGLRNVTKAAININDIFSKGYYVHIDNVPEDDMVDAQGNSLQDRTTDNLKDAERLAINISKRLPKAQVYLMGEDEGVEIEDKELKKLVVNKYAWKLARYRAGSVNNSAIEAINKRIKELELAGDNIDATSVGTRSSSLDRAKKAAKETLGSKLDPTEYTPESYRAYSAYFDSIVSDISNARTVEDLEKLGVETLRKDAEKLLKKKTNNSTDFEDEDPNLDDEEEVTDPRDAVKKMLGEKKASDGYTPESYKKYEAAYAKILAWIEAHPKPAAITQERIDNLKKQAEARLVEIPDEDPNLEDEDDTPETTDETKTTEKDTDSDDDETTDESSDEDLTGTDTAGKIKLSEVSEEQLKKLFTAVTGQGVGDNKKWQKVLTRMRMKLKELGEDLESDTIAEEELREVLQSEAEAVKNLKDTAASLKATAGSMQNMTSAMREEYHKYANPAELKAMEDLEAVIENAKNTVLNTVNDWGIQMDESDNLGWMSNKNEYCYQIMVDYEGADQVEEEDIQDQIQVIFENEVLTNYQLPAEISNITFSVMLPDPDIAYDDFDEEELQSYSRGSILIYVTFARKLF